MYNMKNPRYGGFWIRFLAAVLDLIIIGIPLGAINLLLFYFLYYNSITYLTQLGYAALVIYLNGVKGGTPGKLILGLRIVNQKGKYIGIPIAILRFISTYLSALILGIGYFMIGWDSKKQGLHDKIAKTFVIKV
ncbi:hypothetical protein CMO83_03220 [Candidatus Woesearchaeota archaeon]|jgi:uncharacterized RDD family membrane protein YckC|nr:hypothetical protein [Candidatus Woesearchaeota archaeon]|tara:strand:- start:15708 stop:16109 length:402 start_codon:yes stop_codon:yes gene_type:complete